MNSSSLEAGLAHILENIVSTNVSIRVLVDENLVVAVLDSVKQHTIELLRTNDSGEDPQNARGMAMTVVKAAIHAINIEKLAQEQDTSIHAVRRALRGILDQAQKLTAKINADHTHAKKSAPQLYNETLNVDVASRLGDIIWPASIPDHTTMLMRALTTVYQTQKQHKALAIVSKKDLETLLLGSKQLELKVNDVYTNLLNRVAQQDKILPDHAIEVKSQAPCLKAVDRVMGSGSTAGPSLTIDLTGDEDVGET